MKDSLITKWEKFGFLEDIPKEERLIFVKLIENQLKYIQDHPDIFSIIPFCGDLYCNKFSCHNQSEIISMIIAVCRRVWNNFSTEAKENIMETPAKLIFLSNNKTVPLIAGDFFVCEINVPNYEDFDLSCKDYYLMESMIKFIAKLEEKLLENWSKNNFCLYIPISSFIKCENGNYAIYTRYGVKK